MKKKNLGSSLSKSIQAEEDKFSKADQVFAESEAPLSPGKKVEKNPKPKSNPKPPARTRNISDAFSFPEQDHAIIGEIIEAALDMKMVTNKSEVVRAGLLALKKMGKKDLKEALSRVEKVKAGRPRRA